MYKKFVSVFANFLLLTLSGSFFTQLNASTRVENEDVLIADASDLANAKLLLANSIAIYNSISSFESIETKIEKLSKIINNIESIRNDYSSSNTLWSKPICMG